MAMNDPYDTKLC